MAIPTIPLPSAESESVRVPYDQRRISPDEFGAGIGEGLQRLGAGLDKASGEADAMAAQEAETSYAQEVLRSVHGTSDPQTGELKPGLAQMQGHAAIEASARLTQELTQSREQRASVLANDRQRRLFLGRTADTLLGAQRAIEAHAGEQVAFLRREGLKTQLEVASQNAAATVLSTGGNVDLIGAARQIDAMQPWLEVAAEQQGLQGEDAQRFVRAGKAAVAVSVLERLLEDPQRGGRGHGAEAKAFLEAHRDVLSPEQAAQYGRRVSAADVRDRSMAEADRIWTEANGDPTAAIAASREIKDEGLRDEVAKRLDSRIQEDHLARVAADSPREARLEVDVYQGRGLDRRSQDYLALSDEGKARVEAKARASARSDSAEQRAIDQELYWTFKGMPIAGAPGQDRTSVDVDHSGTFAGASPAMRARINYEQEQSKAEWAKDNGVGREGFLTKARAIADELRWLGSEAKGAPSKRASFLRAVEAKYDEWLQANPTAKVVPPDQARAIFAEALRYGDLGTAWGLSPNRYAWEVRSAEDAAKFTGKGFAQPGLAAVERAFGPAKVVAPVRVDAPPVPGAVRSKSGRWMVRNAQGQWEYL